MKERQRGGGNAERARHTCAAHTREARNTRTKDAIRMKRTGSKNGGGVQSQRACVVCCRRRAQAMDLGAAHGRRVKWCNACRAKQGKSERKSAWGGGQARRGMQNVPCTSTDGFTRLAPGDYSVGDKRAAEKMRNTPTQRPTILSGSPKAKKRIRKPHLRTHHTARAAAPER